MLEATCGKDEAPEVSLQALHNYPQLPTHRLLHSHTGGGNKGWGFHLQILFFLCARALACACICVLWCLSGGRDVLRYSYSVYLSSLLYIFSPPFNIFKALIHSWPRLLSPSLSFPLLFSLYPGDPSNCRLISVPAPLSRTIEKHKRLQKHPLNNNLFHNNWT